MRFNSRGIPNVSACLIASAALLLLLPGLAFAQPTPPIGKAWEKVEALSDEFDSWNGTKWTKSLWNYGEPVMMKAENSGVSDGKLWIKATLGSDADRWFETSRVMSRTRIKFPMYTECRMRTAHISAYSTYWLNNGNSANRDEIDICEHNTNPSAPDQDERPYTMYSQYFIVKDNAVERHHGNFDNRNLIEGNPAKGVKWNEEYQVLGCWWKDAHHIQFYINGEPAGSVTSSQEFTLSQNIIWDLWTTDASWAGGIADKNHLGNDSINTYYIDWIHTYSLVDGPDVALESISIDDSLSLEVDQAKALSPVFEPSNSTERELRWTSLNEDIARVDEDGLVTGMDTGNTRVAVEAIPSGLRDTCLVEVTPGKIRVTKVVVTPDWHVMEKDTGFQLEATVLPEDAYNKELVWRSSKTSIVTVDSTGYVSALKTGYAYISATSLDGGFMAQCTLQVVDEIVPTGGIDKTGRTRKDIGIFPNPARDEMTISGLSKLSETGLMIRDLQGRCVWEQNPPPGFDPVIKLHPLPPGIYILIIIHSEGAQSFKFFKSEI